MKPVKHLILLFLLFSGPALTAENDRNMPVDISAAFSDFDAAAGTTLLRGKVIISQGSLQINAAEGQVFSKDRKISRVQLQGSPAHIEQTIDGKGQMEASANQIEYDASRSVIILTGNARILHPQGELSGESIRYDLIKESFQGQSQNGDDRVHIILEPAEEPALEEETGANAESGDSS